MFQEITDLAQILELGEAGLLYDSWYIREADSTNPHFGELVWDMKQPIEAQHWSKEQYEMHDPEWVNKYKFYIRIEE